MIKWFYKVQNNPKSYSLPTAPFHNGLVVEIISIGGKEVSYDS